MSAARTEEKQKFFFDSLLVLLNLHLFCDNNTEGDEVTCIFSVTIKIQAVIIQLSVCRQHQCFMYKGAGAHTISVFMYYSGRAVEPCIQESEIETLASFHFRT